MKKDETVAVSSNSEPEGSKSGDAIRASVLFDIDNFHDELLNELGEKEKRPEKETVAPKKETPLPDSEKKLTTKEEKRAARATLILDELLLDVTDEISSKDASRPPPEEKPAPTDNAVDNAVTMPKWSEEKAERRGLRATLIVDDIIKELESNLGDQ
jgi:hypothetical protein